jgi:SAM-dependent methyltransferase
VICDVASLPFKSDSFDSLVSLHTLHHLPPDEHVRAYRELHRTLATNGKGAIVNGWDNPPLTIFLNIWISLFEWLYRIARPNHQPININKAVDESPNPANARGTYVRKENDAWLQEEVGSLIPITIWCWRSISVRFLRTFVHERFAGKLLLVYGLEELFPHLLGRYGQYPLVEVNKK